ncbi:MAG: acyl-CoA synthetase [Rubrivivax sp.]|nr:MAG: acyl-CoA synthetase [Rubrivivax sp.]
MTLPISQHVQNLVRPLMPFQDGLQNSYEVLRQGACIEPGAKALSFFLDVKDHAKPFIWTHAEMIGEVTRAANMFRRHGLHRGDVVAMVLPNVPEAYWTIWGAETACTVMPINPLLEASMIGDLMKSAGAKALVTLAPTPKVDIWQKIASVVNEVPSLEKIFTVSPLKYLRSPWRPILQLKCRFETPDELKKIPVYDFSEESSFSQGHQLVFEAPSRNDIASYFCTGGTTGMPKIAMRSHKTEVSNSSMVADVLSELLSPGVSIFCGLPLFHVNAQLGSGLIPWSRGAHVILGTPQGYRAPGLMKRFWELVEYHQIASFSGVPTVYANLLKMPQEGRNLASLKIGICGAAPLAPQLLNQFQNETGIKILEGYGLTEAGCVSTLAPLHGIAKSGSVGVSVPGQRILAVVLDEHGRYLRDAQEDEAGVLVIHGPNTFAGYLDPAQNKGLWVDRTEKDGRVCRWLNTGDMGRVDADGFVFLTGRKKELIIRGGHNIDPKAIEEPLHGHPAIAMAAAVGRPDQYAGEIPVAYVQLHPGASVTLEELMDFAKKNIAEKAAVPKAIYILSQLPTTAVGKVFKPALLMMQIEEVIRNEAQKAGAVINRMEVAQDSKIGFVANYESIDPNGLLKQALGNYTFHSIELRTSSAA